MEEQSLAEFYYSALGIRYALLLLLSALLSFAIALAVVIKGKGPTVGPALVLSTLMPLGVAFLSFVDGLLSSYMVISKSTTTPSPEILAVAWTYSLASLHVGLLLAIPTFLVAVFGASIRALFAADRP